MRYRTFLALAGLVAGLVVGCGNEPAGKLAATSTPLRALSVDQAVRVQPTYDWCAPRTIQTECGGEWCSLFDHLNGQPDDDWPLPPAAGFDEWLPCCTTSNGWTIAVRPTSACETAGDVCSLSSANGWNVIVLHENEWDWSCP
jgi:hypothetical protein